MKLNQKSKNVVPSYSDRDLAVSYNGNVQFAKGPEQDLFEIAVSTLYGNDTYYESSNDKVTRLRALVDKLVAAGKSEYVANVAVFARKTMLIRTMPIVLIVELARSIRDFNAALDAQVVALKASGATKSSLLAVEARYVKVDGLKNAINTIIERVDGITEMYAYALSIFGTKGNVPLAIKKGVGLAMNKFDEYQFSKYNSKDASVKLRDVVRIVHPTPKDEAQSEIFKKILDQTLTQAATWNNEMSANGQLGAEAKSKKEVWEAQIAKTGKGEMGYMAMLRNLRNFIDAGVSQDAITTVVKKLTDPAQVAKSKQFPFAFMLAAKALESNFGDVHYQSSSFLSGNTAKARILNALVECLELSLGNLPMVAKSGMLIVIDCSGSMQGAPFQTACLLAAAALKSNRLAPNCEVIMFSDYAKIVPVRRQDSIMTIYEKLLASNFGGGTNIGSALDMVPKLGFKPDMVFCLSDMQVNRLNGINAANRAFSNDAVKIAFNLSAYESTPMSELDGWIQLAGWSEKIFQYVEYKRQGSSITQYLMETKQY